MPITVGATGQDATWKPSDLTAVKRRLVRWREDPILFSREVVGVDPVPDQQRLLASLASFDSSAGKFGTTVRSGKGCGKSRGAVLAMLWFLVCFRYSLVHCTANKEKQLKTILWNDAEKLINGSPFLRQTLEWQSTTIQVRNEPTQWQAFGNTAKSVEAIQGEHRTDLLMIADEASGIPDTILNAMLGGLTEAHNVALLISNPTLPHGVFYKSHNDEVDFWDALHFNARESPLVTPESIARLERKYGVNSPLVRIEVDGEFPDQSDFALISAGWIDAARSHVLFEDSDEISIGVDIARYGADSTAVCVRRGSDILDITRWHGADTSDSCGRIIDIIKQWDSENQAVVTVNVDEQGMGGPLIDILHEQQDNGRFRGEIEVLGVNVSTQAADYDSFVMLRDELWFQLSDRLRDGALAIAPEVEDELVTLFRAEAMPVEYKFMSDGRRKVESKDEMRKKTGGSPDIVDAIILAFHEDASGVIGWLS